MPIITHIKQQKNINRVNVYLDGKFGFGIDLDNFVKLGLRVEQELTGEEVGKIVRTAEFQKTLDKLLRFAMVRPRSEKEVYSWFYRRKIPEVIQPDLLAKLKKLELLNDKKFAVWWISQRTEFRPKGKTALKYELLQKGVDRGIITKVLQEAPIDEEQIAKGLLTTKAYKWKSLDTQIARQKKSAFLARKGFGWEVIKKVI